MNKKIIIVSILSCLLAVIVGTWVYGTIPSPEIFDKLITTNLVVYGCKNVVPHEITRVNNGFQLEYRIDFKLDTTEPDLFSIIIIKIQPSWFYTPSFGLFISPHGGGDMTSFTTADGRFDIIIEQHNHGMEGVISPTISTEKLTQELNRLYNQQRRQ